MKRAHPILVGLVLSTIATVTSFAGSHDLAFAGSQTDIAGPPGSGVFGYPVRVLANGNFVVADSTFDDGPVIDVGAVYLYDGATRQLISTLTGTTAGDMIGLGGVDEVGNANFVVRSPFWTNRIGPPAARAGAVTWVNGTTGLDGDVGPTNSLFGSTADDLAGVKFELLSNGNYVIGSPFFRAGGIGAAGAATWANGNAPMTGAITGANSLVGTSAHDQIGGQLTALTNGNYVTTAPFWDDLVHGTTDGGAATWGNGSTAGPRTVGAVSTSNSLWGPGTNNWVGGNEVLPLTNGNYVVLSPAWDLGAVQNVGAATLANGSSGLVGFVAASNSLHGSTNGDLVGGSGSDPLTNGNYVIVGVSWDDVVGGHANAGAATWRDGSTGAIGVGAPVSQANSLYGGTIDDQVSVAGITPLANGNYVVQSTDWHNGGGVRVGAATWSEGLGGTHGLITPINSLVGSTFNDSVGSDVIALTNGNYVVGSHNWDNGLADRAGAATWGNGTTGVVGLISPINSLVGTIANDSVGEQMTPLTNGNYVVSSPRWNGLRGATTWGSGTGGVVGTISETTSFIGDVPGDTIANSGVTALTNGNFVINSPSWHRGAIVEAGASTLGNGLTGIVGHVTTLNSLVGTSTADKIGYGTDALPDGSYVVYSERNNGAIIGAGSATFALPSGVHGEITPLNTVIGTAPMSGVGAVDRYTTDGSVLTYRYASNLVTLYKPDRSAPVFPAPTNVTAVAAPGAPSVVVTYATPVATDDVGVPTVVCTPPPGSTFPRGTTTVTCTATNTEGLTATTTFTVTVGDDYIPVAPARLADTRADGITIDGLFAGTGLRLADSTLDLDIAGRGGVPLDATAVTLNVTVTEARDAGFLTVYPCDEPRPTASNLNYSNGSTIPNAVITKLGAGGPMKGAVCIYVQQAVHVVVDVNGFFPPTTTYHSINPARVLDTRPGSSTIDGQQAGGGVAAPGSVTTLSIGGRAGVPADASAVVLNVTVTEPAAPGYATVYPCGTEPPTASNLNYTPGLTIPNLVIAKIGTAQAVCVFTQSTTHLIADVLGYFPASTTYAALIPARLLDTRPAATTIDGRFAGSGAVPIGTVTVVHVLGRGGVPANALTAVLNVTVTEPVAAGFVTVYPCGPNPASTAPPLASNLNFVAGQTIPNAVLTQIGSNGDVCIFNSQPTHLIADVTGYFP